MKRNEEKEKISLSGDVIYPESLIKQNEATQKIWNERIGNFARWLKPWIDCKMNSDR